MNPISEYVVYTILVLLLRTTRAVPVYMKTHIYRVLHLTSAAIRDFGLITVLVNLLWNIRVIPSSDLVASQDCVRT